MIELPIGVGSRDLVECPSCAGHALRVREDGGRCCGRTYTLTFEFGAFAAEKM
jgi:hypothetical protein